MQTIKMWQLILIPVVIVLPVMVAVASCDLTGHTHDVAQKEADAWIKEMGLDAKASCADTDSDLDGYVSCTLVIRSEKGPHIEPLECAGSMTINKGCRAPKAVIRR